MERLTEHHVDGKGAYMKCSEFCELEELDCVRCEKSDAILDRLAAYEDTGLEPEQIEHIKNALMGKSIAEIKELDGIPIKRLQELAQAEKDGRLVVLPLEARDGDPIPQCFYGDGGLCLGLSAPNDDEPIEMCKRCWYCSCGYRQEAEEALGKETENG